MTDRTDRIQDRTIRTESWVRTFGKGQPGPESQKRTERTEQPEKDDRNRNFSFCSSLLPSRKGQVLLQGTRLQRRLMDSEEITRIAKDYSRVIAGKV